MNRNVFLAAMIFTMFFRGGGSFAGDAPLLPVEDVPFRQATSVKFKLNEKMTGAKFKKVVVDYRDNVYVLTDQGLARDFPEAILAKDYTFAPLADKMPVDVCVQEGTGYLYYLYPTRYLSNAHAGTILGRIPENKYQQILVNVNYDILLLGNDGCTMFHRNEKIADFPRPKETLVKFCVVGNDFYYLSGETLYRLVGQEWKPVHKGKNMTAVAFDADKIYIGTTNGYYSILFDGTAADPVDKRLPVPEITAMLNVGGNLWFASKEGAFVKEGENFRYFAWKRWLSDNKVSDLAADSEGNIYLLTETGLNEIRYVTQTLAEKAEKIQKHLERYHMRFGWSVESSLVDPSDPTTSSLRDDDNDGLWTSMYLGSQVFRFLVTGDEKARRNIWESFEAFERNLSIHNVPGFSARTFERKGYATSVVEWRDAPDEDWVWKGTTSTDEVVGYIFVAALMDKFIVQTPEEKKRVADYIDVMLTHVIDNDYYFIDYDGKPTLWGRWHKDYVNRFAKTQFDRKLNSVLITAMFQLGYKLTGKEIYKTEAFRLFDEWGYMENMHIPMKDVQYTTGFKNMGITLGEDWNHSDDEMAFLTYWVLHDTAFNPDLEELSKWITADHWEIEAPERNALWNVIPYAISGTIDLDSTLWWLREFNMDLTRYRMRNSHRKDIVLLSRDPLINFRDQRTETLLTQGEAPMMRHNANGFDLDGGNDGRTQLAGEEFLLPYWMCRYYGVITEAKK